MRKITLLLLISICTISCENNESSEIEKTFIVASKKVDCMGLAPQKCFLIKEKNQQNWQYLYDSISNFEYEEGFEYEILVSQKEIENPPQDASSIETKLIEILSKIEKTSENLPN